MNITDELREWYKDRIFMANGWAEIAAIADRIDAEHESACAEAYGKGVMSVPIALDESAWVKLPVDADGVPIHVGDVMEWVDIEGEVTLTCEVAAVGVECFFAWDKANGRYAQKSASAYRHHHAPTVEDVLREFALACEDAGNAGPEVARIAAEYAAKLRLAEGEDA